MQDGVDLHGHSQVKDKGSEEQVIDPNTRFLVAYKDDFKIAKH